MLFCGISPRSDPNDGKEMTAQACKASLTRNNVVGTGTVNHFGELSGVVREAWAYGNSLGSRIYQTMPIRKLLSEG